MMLAPNGCRPFDAARNGLQLGEGAGAIWLTADDTKNGFTLTGGANRCDTYHVTSSQPDGAGMAACMTAALRDANVAATAVRAIKAHGTGSLENDAAEAAAMRTLFGPQPPPFTGLKRYLGHTLGACGVVETIAFLGCLARGFVPASAGFADADPALALTPLTRHADAAPGDYLLNYFGFGGNFASLVVRRD
jgi:3-oxoacyl-[acyl-carrier-protein] synthase-1